MSKVKTNKPVSEQEINQAADILSRLEPGFLPFPIFIQATRLTVTSIIELVPFRKTEDNKVEVFLNHREQGDIFWPNLLCNPGAVFRATDYTEGFTGVLRRLFKDDLQTDYQESTFVSHIFHKTLRGIDSSHIFWVELKEKPPVGDFYDVYNLPEDMVDSSIEIIKMALEHYLKHGKQN